MANFEEKKLLRKQLKADEIQTMWKINFDVRTKITKHKDFRSIRRICRNYELKKTGHNYFPQCI